MSLRVLQKGAIFVQPPITTLVLACHRTRTQSWTNHIHHSNASTNIKPDIRASFHPSFPSPSQTKFPTHTQMAFCLNIAAFALFALSPSSCARPTSLQTVLKLPINNDILVSQASVNNVTMPACVALPKTDSEFVKCPAKLQISTFTDPDFEGAEMRWEARAYACMTWTALTEAHKVAILSLKPTAPAFCLLYETENCVDTTHAMLNMPNDGSIASIEPLMGIVKGMRCHVGPENRYIPCGEGMTAECPDWHDEASRRQAGLALKTFWSVQWERGWKT
jgi:hypothetical protein